jgi:lysyl oxidase
MHHVVVAAGSLLSRRMIPGCRSGLQPDRLHAPPLFVTLIALLVLVVPTRLAQGQVTILSETFEGSFPADNGWTVGDADPTGTPAYWDDVHSSFGGEGAHDGAWKGYCAGIGYGGTSANPVYQDSMRAFMRRSIDLTGYAGAELRFWYKIPSMDDFYESLRVYIDGRAVYARDTSAAAWSEAIVNLSDFVGASHTLSLEFSADTFTLHEGCYLDDITVLGYASPPNDDFASAAVLSGAAGSANGFNNGATKEGGEPDHAGNAGGHSIWYRWTAPSSASVNFNTSGSGFDTLLAVYVGGSVGTLVQVAANDDIYGAQNLQSRLRFTPLSGSTYWIAVDGYAGRTGSVRLTWQQGGVPDMIVYGPAAGPYLTVVTFANDSCEVLEGLTTGGTRKLVRFSTESRNIGTSDLLMGDPAGNPLFTPGVCHAHNHFNGYANFRVRDNGGTVVANGNKVGFCLEDTSRWNGAANPSQVFTCGYQGLQAGWADTYISILPGQWVDITGLPAGNYFLEQEVNPDRILEESSYGNNVTQVSFTIPPYDNNDFVNATRFGNNVSTVTGNNGSATKEFNEPNHAGDAGGKSIWYCWTAASGAGVVFDTIGSSFDTLLAVYTGNSIATLALVAQNDDIDVFNLASRVTFTPVNGTTYWIAVDGYFGASGSVVLNLSPANNNFTACQVIAGTAGSVIGFNLGANLETGEPNHAGTLGGRSVWYCWTAPTSDEVEFNTLGSSFDTLLAVYTGGSVNSLTEVASNDDINGLFNRQSRMVFGASGGTTYRIAVDGYFGASGAIALTWGYKCRLTGSNAAGHFLITLHGVPRGNYLIECSDDFAFWRPETTVSTDLSGVGSYDAGLIRTTSQRFYRAFLQP